ncbi:glycoside hydrolase family 15 protein [Candidatus Pantoea soli]|uniref:Glycoside hydrolase family 15 protein n=1 Tax=Candidatus Pantoea soli TaxID=3098669 RepID=A0A518XHX7_9GAMM|nr:glycoside hydrolase family 15 protein [Pantoea soli]QDY43800.1 glycoside hydrolase family 15 protein [Pantoea soli]
MNNQILHSPMREKGFARLGDYAAIGEGRSVALIAPDGAIDWWCAPNLDSPPLFDRLLDPAIGGFFQIEPTSPYHTERAYRDDSNVLETRFITEQGSVLLTESLNSTLAGRLPWSELARRIEGVEGEVELRLTLRFGTQAETRSPWRDSTEQGDVYHIADLMAMLRTSEAWQIVQRDDERIDATLRTSPGSHALAALLVTEREPLAVPDLDAIDTRIETSHTAWCDWTRSLSYRGRFAEHVRRSALSLKFLWYSPTGALAAAATTSLPEGIGGEKNYDYRYAWVRDACLIIKAFVFLGALEDCKAAFSWLSKTIIRHGTALRACYTLEGNTVPAEYYPPLQGYHDSRPVRIGNNARDQVQLSMYGDMLATAELFIQAGHILDLATSRMLGELANHCADLWRQKDSGIWELPEQQHYTHSKMACWLALDRAVALAEARHIEPTWLQRWQRERDRISEWIETHCWSEQHQAYLFYPGSGDRLDAALALVHAYGSRVNPARMRATYQAIRQHLGHNTDMLYRYSGVEQEESTFIACSFWLAEARAAMGDCADAERAMQAILHKLCQRGNVETFNEMFDVRTDEWRGNMPQGLSHLALICAAQALTERG